MIRDEFKQQQTKNVTSREMGKIRQLGERGFYSSRITMLTSTIKMLNFSSIFALIACAVAAPLLIFNVIYDKTLSSNGLVASLVIISALVVISLIWFFCIRIIFKKKIARYKEAIKELNEQNAKKQTNMFKAYNK